MLVNGAGAFTSVVSAIDLQQLSFAVLVEQFGALPATSQAAIVMAVLSAFIIPIGALVAGEGLALLVLERRNGFNLRESEWREVAFLTTYRAMFVRYLHSGLPDCDAKLKAMSEVKGYLSAGTLSVCVRFPLGLYRPHTPHRKVPYTSRAPKPVFVRILMRTLMRGSYPSTSYYLQFVSRESALERNPSRVI